MFKSMHGLKYYTSTSIFLFDYLFAKVKNEAMPSGNFKTESSKRVCMEVGLTFKMSITL